VTRKFRTLRLLPVAAGLAVVTGCLLTPSRASAEITVAKGDTWEAYVAGRAGAFISYAFGDGYPVPVVAGSTIQPGGGVDAFVPARDTILPNNPMGMPDVTKQGELKKMRVRSGYYPNILTIGVRKTYGPNLKLTAQLSIWGTIESEDTRGAGSPEFAPANGTRDNSVYADFKEGFLQGEGSWGKVQAGRFMSLVGRGHSEIDMLYGHGYGVGFPMVVQSFNLPVAGNLTYPGPTSGMTGFGVLGNSYTPGVAYTTPSLSGLKVAIGVFEASKYLTASWTATRYPRPEAEITYDMDTGGFKLHVFGSGGLQKLYQSGQDNNETAYGATGGARVEVGPVRIGGGGFFGKGIGVDYAFDDNAAVASSTAMKTIISNGMPLMVPSFALRNQLGFFGMAQVVLGPVDIGGGFGQTSIASLDADKLPTIDTNADTIPDAAGISHLKTQTGYFAAIVYHLSENLHADIDFINGAYKWTNGESQKLNVINGGLTMTF
jgi:hypothetical protein